MTLEEGNKMYPAFNWTDHVRNILDNPVSAHLSKQLQKLCIKY